MLEKVEAEPRASSSDQIDILLACAMLALVHPLHKTWPRLVHAYETSDHDSA